jgi:hypothetical protein
MRVQFTTASQATFQVGGAPETVLQRDEQIPPQKGTIAAS